MLFVSLLGIFLALLGIWNCTGKEGAAVTVLIDGKETASYSLKTPGEYLIHTPDGTNRLVIQDGEAFVKEADCPDGICKHHTPISKVGETVVCLPHKLVFRIDGAAPQDGPDTTV